MPNQEAGLNDDHRMCRAVLHANPGSATRSLTASFRAMATFASAMMCFGLTAASHPSFC
jgi:hypothetical protein